MANPSDPTGLTNEPGRQVIAGRYEVQGVLGRGGMGEVLLAHDDRLDRRVAIKLLRPELAGDAAFLDRFEREARALARVRHPGVIQVHDILRPPDGGLYLVLEYVPGATLAERIHAGPLPWDECARIGAEVCAALDAAHAAGVVHRDVKPSNILIEPGGQVRVADFGVARLVDVSATHSGVLIGTPGYMAPEQAVGRRATPSTDLYSLTAVLFEAACGRPPFVAEEPSTPAVALMHVVEPVPDPRRFAPDLPDAARDILLRGLAKDPADRPPSAAAYRAALRASAGLPPERVPGGDAAGAAPVAAAGWNRTAPGAPAPPGEPTAATVPPLPAVPAAPPPADDPRAEVTARTVAPPPPAPAGPARERTPTAATAPVGEPVREAPPGRAGATPPARHRRRGPLVAAAAAGALLVGAGVGMVAFGGEDAPAAVAAVPADNGAVRVSHPADWTVGGSARVPGLTMPRPITLAAPDGAALTAGLSAATGLTLLPEPLRARVRGGLPPADGVRLGALAGLRYEGVRLAGAADRRFDLYVAATTGGVYTAACQAAPDGLAAVRDACGSIAASVRLLGGRRAVPLAPNAAYGRAVRGPLDRYSTASSAALASLRDAGTRGAQASAAGDAAAAARTLAGRLAGVAPGPQIADRHAALVDAARGLGRAYAALAAAGRAGSDAAWDAARRRVGAAGDALELAQADLAKAGYPPR